MEYSPPPIFENQPIKVNYTPICPAPINEINVWRSNLYILKNQFSQDLGIILTDNFEMYPCTDNVIVFNSTLDTVGILYMLYVIFA